MSSLVPTQNYHQATTRIDKNNIYKVKKTISGFDVAAYEVWGSQTQKIMITKKVLGQREFIDVRKWIIFPGSTEYVPQKKGITIDVHIWPSVLEKINFLLQDKENLSSKEK